VARMVDRHLKSGEEFLDMYGAPAAYMLAQPIGTWQYARGDRLHIALRYANVRNVRLFYDLRGDWPLRRLQALRLEQNASHTESWDLQDVQVFSLENRIRPGSEWSVTARPNPWEAPLALDDNFISGWYSWQPMRPGMFWEVNFGRPRNISSLVAVSTRLSEAGKVTLRGQTPEGEWVPLPLRTAERPALDLRQSATRLVKTEGLRYILAPAGEGGHGPIGSVLLGEGEAWGVELLDKEDHVHLFRIR
jgi:hypothetical protein